MCSIDKSVESGEIIGRSDQTGKPHAAARPARHLDGLEARITRKQRAQNLYASTTSIAPPSPPGNGEGKTNRSDKEKENPKDHTAGFKNLRCHIVSAQQYCY